MTTRAVLFDLDDTLISAYRNPLGAWTAIAGELGPAHGAMPAELVGRAVTESVRRFLSNDTNRRMWRLAPLETRRSVVLAAFEQLLEEGLHLPDGLALAMADRYESYRDENMHLLPGALDVLEKLRAQGLRLGLLTNGSTRVQRRKIERFELEDRFDFIQIEEEAGIGKPAAEAYRRALAGLDAHPEESWMVGDDLLMDIVPSSRLGMEAAWVNPDEAKAPHEGVPPHTRLITSLAEVPALIGGVSRTPRPDSPKAR